MSVYIEFEKAYNAIPYPIAKKISEERWQEFLAKPQPTMSMVLTQGDLKELIKSREAEHHAAVKADIAKLRQAYHEATAKVDHNFRQALAKEYLTGEGKEKEAKVFSLAWQKGHANGYAEVESHYQDLADLVNP